MEYYTTNDLRIKKQVNKIAEHLGYKELTNKNAYYIMGKIWRYWETLRDFFGYYFLTDCWLYLKNTYNTYYEKIMAL